MRQMPEQLEENFAGVAATGARLGVDDFGTGYASLPMLQHVRASAVCIDRKLVAGLPVDAERAGLAKALITLARGLNFDVVAKGVETHAQRDFLAEKLPGYAVFSAGRDDGKDAGESAAVFYRKERFEKLDGGHFWLSETPDVPGSKGWDAALPRVATWVRLKDRAAPDRPPVLFLNTHLDHRGAAADAVSRYAGNARGRRGPDQGRVRGDGLHRR